MRRFRYRLQAALRRAERAEQTRQMELAEADREARRAASRQAALEARRLELWQRFRARQREEMAADAMGMLGAELAHLERALAAAARGRLEAEGQRETARRRLLEAARERETLERHRQMLLQEHVRAALREEIKQGDELAAARFAARASRREQR